MVGHDAGAIECGGGGRQGVDDGFPGGVVLGGIGLQGAGIDAQGGSEERAGHARPGPCGKAPKRIVGRPEGAGRHALENVLLHGHPIPGWAVMK